VESTGKTPDHPQYGVTRSGAIVEQGVTIAVDPSVIALGSYVYIDGLADYIKEIVGCDSSNIRIAQDTGSDIKGNRIDVYVTNVDDARALGRISLDVYLLD
jgi:3D (Asp-Asp-Asp) domain-containing protein